jgi:hypothetical protein
MTETTYEEATRCPKCGNPGEVAIKAPAPRQARLPRGTQIHTVYCRRELCPWNNTCWMVQVNADGTVPAPKNHRGEPKLYAGFEGHDNQANELIKQVRENAALEEEQQRQPGHEQRNPFSR